MYRTQKFASGFLKKNSYFSLLLSQNISIVLKVKKNKEKKSKEEQLKLKKRRMTEKKSLYIKVLLDFDDDAIFQLGTDLLTLEDVFLDKYLKSIYF